MASSYLAEAVLGSELCQPLSSVEWGGAGWRIFKNRRLRWDSLGHLH